MSLGNDKPSIDDELRMLLVAFEKGRPFNSASIRQLQQRVAIFGYRIALAISLCLGLVLYHQFNPPALLLVGLCGFTFLGLLAIDGSRLSLYGLTYIKDDIDYPLDNEPHVKELIGKVEVNRNMLVVEENHITRMMLKANHEKRNDWLL